MEQKKLQEELSKIAEWRVKQLEGLSRRDRQKMLDINEKYNIRVDELMEKHRKQEYAQKKKGELDAKAKAKADAKKADEEAKAKMSGK